MSPRPLVLISGRDPVRSTGGHESYVRAHALAVARLGFDAHVFCASAQSGIERTAFGTVHRVGSPVGAQPPVVVRVGLVARAVSDFLAEHHGPHLLHGFSVWSAAGVAAARRLARRGVGAAALGNAYGTRAYEIGTMQPGLTEFGLRDRAHYRAWYRWVRTFDDPLEGWGYRRARVVLVNYGSVERILNYSYGGGIATRRMPYALEAAFADAAPPVPRRPPDDPPLILAVSRHDPRKGLAVLLAALARLTRTGVPFRACLVGTGRLLEPHRRLARSLGITGQVEIVGEVPDVAPYLERASVFVLPSLAEASGSVSVLEALRAGVPVLASACDGVPEDLSHGQDALLVPPGDPVALATALHRLLASPELRLRLAAGGRRTYQRRFSAPQFVDALGEVYAQLGCAA